MIDYCETKISVVARTVVKVQDILVHCNAKVDEFDEFEDFMKFLDKHRIKDSCGFNKNKKGYMETLKFIYELEHNNTTERPTSLSMKVYGTNNCN